MRLTDAAVAQLEPNGRDQLIADDRLAGFVLRLTPAGKKIFMARGRVAGRRRLVPLGYHPDLKVASARQAAIQALADMQAGRDPIGQRKAREKAVKAGTMTVNELADKWMAEHVEPKLKPTSARSYKRALDRHIRPRFGHLAVASVTRDDMIAMHVAMKATPRYANYAVSMVRSMITFGIDLGLRPYGSNPVYKIKKYRERNCERFLDEDEFARAAQSITDCMRSGKISVHAAAGLRLALLTGARSGEITAMQWHHIDWERKFVRLPDSKTNEPRTVYLSDAALEVLRTLPRVGCYVIAASRYINEPYTGLNQSWCIVRQHAGLDDVRLHDLRHSFASLAARRGVPLLMIGKLLGHRKAATTERYAHLAPDTVASVNEELGTAMMAAIEKGPPPAVVQLPGRRKSRA
jgi:integrase